MTTQTRDIRELAVTCEVWDIKQDEFSCEFVGCELYAVYAIALTGRCVIVVPVCFTHYLRYKESALEPDDVAAWLVTGQVAEGVSA